MTPFAPPPVSLRQLQYIVAVAEHLSFRKAAEVCHVAQPSLSAQVAGLEGALGVRIFERDHTRVLLTGAGAILVEQARSVLHEMDDLTQAARRLVDPLVSTVRIGVIPTLAPYLLPLAVPQLLSHHPQLRVQWTEDRTTPLLRRLREGHLDAALVALTEECADLDRAELGVDPFFLAVGQGNPLAGSELPVSVEALRGVEMLLLDDGHCMRDQALSFCTAAGLHESGFRATSLPTLVQMVSAGGGTTLLPRIALDMESARAGIHIRPIADPAPFRTLALVWRPRSPLAEALGEIARVVRGVGGQPPTAPSPLPSPRPNATSHRPPHR